MAPFPDDLSGMDLYASPEEALAEAKARRWGLRPVLVERRTPDGPVHVKRVTIGVGTVRSDGRPSGVGGADGDPLLDALHRFEPEIFDLVMAENAPPDFNGTLAAMDPALRDELSAHARRYLNEPGSGHDPL